MHRFLWLRFSQDDKSGVFEPSDFIFSHFISVPFIRQVFKPGAGLLAEYRTQPIAGMFGKETLKDLGFEKRNDCILKQFENMKLHI